MRVAVTGATGTLGKAVCRAFWLSEYVQWTSYKGSSDNDVRDLASIQEWLPRYVDALVTCAGVSLVKPSTDITPDEWRNVIDVNLSGTFYAIQEAVKRGATRIVAVGSIHGCTPTSYPQRAAYTASKGGVAALTQALAVEFAPKGVAVNCVAPGHLPVLMDGTGAGNDLLEAARQRTPTGKLATPEEVAEVIFWLCDSAPLSLTGQIITIDGGFTLNTWPKE